MKATDAIMALSHHQGLFRARDLQALGVARAALAGLVHEGRLTRVSRGIYSASERPVSEYDQLAEVALKYPQGVFCLLTALQIHGLTTQSPHEVWLAVAVKARSPVMTYPALHVVRFSGLALTSGVERKLLDGAVQIPVTTWPKRWRTALSTATRLAWMSPWKRCAKPGVKKESRWMSSGSAPRFVGWPT